MPKVVSQRTIVEIMRALREAGRNYTEELYAVDFADWFVRHAKHEYNWNWTKILMELRSGMFFDNPGSYGPSSSITGEYLSENSAKQLGERHIHRLAAYAATLVQGAQVIASLQLDGFDVDKANLRLIALEGPVSAKQEEDRLTTLVKASSLPNDSVILQHIQDAVSLYTQGSNHPSLGQSRNIIQALIDGISESTNTNGKHSTKLPGKTGPRIEYLKDLGFFTADEETAFKSGWGTLSAGTHPGVPEREQARIGLVLALEFAQLLLFKFANWRLNAYQRFS